MRPQQRWLSCFLKKCGKLNHLPDNFPFNRQLVPACFTLVSAFFHHAFSSVDKMPEETVGFLCRGKDEGDGEVEFGGVLPYIASPGSQRGFDSSGW